MISRKLLVPGSFPACPTLRFADHTLLTETITRPYTFPQHIPGTGILTLLEGTGQFTLNAETITLDPTRYLLIDRGSRLSIRLPGQSPVEGLPRSKTQPLFLFFRTESVTEALTKFHTDFCWLERPHPMNPTFKERLDYLLRQMGNCSSFGNLRADAMIRDILLNLTREAREAATTAGRLKVSRQGTRIDLYKRLSLAREWIHANYSSPTPLDTMAETALLNRQHFLRMFRDCFGITPHQYVIDVRLTVAQQLLTSTNEPVTTICRATGFESLSSFSGLFRQRFGASPTAYRQRPALDRT